MGFLTWILLLGTLIAVAAWVALASYVLAIERRRAKARTTLAAVAGLLEQVDIRSLSLGERLERVGSLLRHASRELVMRAAADSGTSDDAAATLVSYLTERWGT